MTSIVHEHVATSTVLASRSYTRAEGGEPERIEREDGSYVVLGYDGALRLTSEERFDGTGVLRGETAYTFDADGNRETVTRDGVLETYVTSAAAHLDEIVSGGSTVASFAYDGAGRTTSIVRGLESLALGFDPDGNVTSIERGGAPWASYAFDALGRRERVEHAGVTRSYLWAPARGSGLESIHAVADETGAPVAVYVYADDDRPLMRIVPSTGETFYYLEDAQGSTIALADETGAAVATFEYDPFGEVRVASGPAAVLPSETLGDFRLHGMWMDVTGLYFVRARTYDAETGRFVSRDPAQGCCSSRRPSWVVHVCRGQSARVRRPDRASNDPRLLGRPGRRRCVGCDSRRGLRACAGRATTRRNDRRPSGSVEAIRPAAANRATDSARDCDWRWGRDHGRNTRRRCLSLGPRAR